MNFSNDTPSVQVTSISSCEMAVIVVKVLWYGKNDLTGTRAIINYNFEHKILSLIARIGLTNVLAHASVGAYYI